MLTIGEFSKISRVSAKTLRYYDQIGLLKPEFVSKDSGYRYYEVSQFRNILMIIRLKRYGFSLPEISAILASGNTEQLSMLIQAKKEELIQQIQNQQHIILQMEQDILRIERCESIMQLNYLVKTVQIEPKYIYSHRDKTSIRDLGQMFGTLYAGLKKNKLCPSGPFLSIYYDEEFNPECTDIEVATEVVVKKSEHVRTFSPGFCCFATHIGPYDDFTPCYTVLMEWIENNHYTIAGPPFELYVKGCDDNISPNEYVTEIYIPIKYYK